MDLIINLGEKIPNRLSQLDFFHEQPNVKVGSNIIIGLLSLLVSLPVATGTPSLCQVMDGLGKP